ncbi:hypothetical protein C8J56DRAFT_922061 [Mycena floridula]|nr:hypothetical protein C8J56DRAFT_922061 [Mycena floridula]
MMTRASMATKESELRRQRDHEAIGWLVSSRMDEIGLEAICELVPVLCAGDEARYYADVVLELIGDQHIMLGERIVGVLFDVSHKHRIKGARIIQRTTTYLEALWAVLSAALFHGRARQCFVPRTRDATTWFDISKTLGALRSLGQEFDWIVPSVKAFLWTKAFSEIRFQLAQLASETELSEFLLRAKKFFLLYSDMNVGLGNDKVFVSFLGKLLEIGQTLQTDRPSDWSQKQHQLLDLVNQALRAVMTDYILSCFLFHAQSDRYRFTQTAITILHEYGFKQKMEFMFDKSGWIRSTQEGLQAIESRVDAQRVDIEALRADMQLAMAGLGLAAQQPLRLIMDGLQASDTSEALADIHDRRSQ